MAALERYYSMIGLVTFSKSIRVGSICSLGKEELWRIGHLLTSAALQQHIKREVYQSICWNRALCVQQELPEPTDWGWKQTASGWEPLWTTISEASHACSELTWCRCKKGYTRCCKCAKAALECTALFNCAGECK